MSGDSAFAAVHSKPAKRFDLHESSGELTLDLASGMGDSVRHCDWAYAGQMGGLYGMSSGFPWRKVEYARVRAFYATEKPCEAVVSLQMLGAKYLVCRVVREARKALNGNMARQTSNSYRKMADSLGVHLVLCLSSFISIQSGVQEYGALRSCNLC